MLNYYVFEFLESYVNTEKAIFKDEQNKFSQEFTGLHDKVFLREERNKMRIYKKAKINTIFKEHKMNYVIKSLREKSGDETYWKVVKSYRESDESK